MKPRSDSKLKTLPEERQEQIIAWSMERKTETCPGGLQHAREQLAADGIKVSLSTLSEFVSWWRLQRRFAAASARAKQIEEMLREQDPSMSPEKVREMGQKIFTLEAVESGDAETFIGLETLALKQRSAETRYQIDSEKLRQSERRIVLLEENAAKAKAALEGLKSKGGLTAETLKTIEEAAGLL